MTPGLLLLAVLGGALAVAVVVLAHEWHWRDAPARPPLPGEAALRRFGALIDGSVAMHALRGLGASLRRGARAPDDRAGTPGEADDGSGPRTIRPVRLVVSGSTGPLLRGGPAPSTRPDPRARLLRDLLAVATLGAAVVAVLVLMPPAPPSESQVLGATGTPGSRTPLPALVTRPPGAAASPAPSPSSVTSVAPASSPGASPSPPVPAASSAPSPASTPPRATPRPTRTPDRATPTPSFTAASPSPSPASSASAPASPSPSPEPSPSPVASPSPSPEASPSPSPEPPPSPSPS